MKKLATMVVFGASLAASGLVNAADIEAGKQKAIMCAGCHGPAGISANPAWPNLAGQKADYLAAQLNEFKNGNRKNDLMTPMAQGLNDEDVANVSAYFASLSCGQ